MADVHDTLPDGMSVKAYMAGKQGNRFAVAFMYDAREPVMSATGYDEHDAVAKLWTKAARVVRAVEAREAARLPKGGV